MMFIDCSCKGLLKIWIIAGAKCGQWLYIDAVWGVWRTAKGTKARQHSASRGLKTVLIGLGATYMVCKGITFSIVAIALLAIVFCVAPFDPLEFSILFGVMIWIWLMVITIYPNRRLQASPRIKTLAAVSFLISLTVITTHWPLRVAFALSRPAFERHIAQIERGEIPHAPTQVGLFYVQVAGSRGRGTTFFWTNTRPSGPIGFVKCPKAILDSKFNIWLTLDLGNGWHLVVED